VLDLPGFEGAGSVLHDISKNHNNGAIDGASWVQLPSGLWVLDYDGTDNKVTIAAAASIYPAVGSILFWAKWDSTAVNQSVIGSNGTATDRWFFGPMGSDNLIYFGIKKANVWGTTNSWLFTDTTSYHQFILSFDGTNLKFYVDTVERGTGASTFGLDHLAAQTMWLGNTSGGDFYWNGQMTLPRIFNSPLSSSEREIYYYQELPLMGV